MGPGCRIGVVSVMRLCFRSSAFSELVSEIGEVVNQEHNILTVSSYDVRVKIAMRIPDFCHGFMEGGHKRLSLNAGTEVTVAVERVEQRLEVPRVECPVELSPKL